LKAASASDKIIRGADGPSFTKKQVAYPTSWAATRGEENGNAFHTGRGCDKVFGIADHVAAKPAFKGVQGWPISALILKDILAFLCKTVQG
jgi:hypothetical protein